MVITLFECWYHWKTLRINFPTVYYMYFLGLYNENFISLKILFQTLYEEENDHVWSCDGFMGAQLHLSSLTLAFSLVELVEVLIIFCNI